MFWLCCLSICLVSHGEDAAWRATATTEDGEIFGIEGVEKTSPAATVPAHLVFHADARPNGAGPQTASFRIKTAAQFGDYDEKCSDDTGNEWVEENVGVNFTEDNVWSVNHGGAMLPLTGQTSVFTPDATPRYDTIQVSAVVYDNHNTDDADDTDWTGNHDGKLTTFVVGVKIQNQHTETVLYVETDPAASKSYTILSGLSDLTAMAETTTLSWDDQEDQSDGWQKSDMKWTTYAVSAGAENIANIRGHIQFQPSAAVTGALDVHAFTYCEGNTTGTDFMTEVINGAAGLAGGAYEKAAAVITSIWGSHTSAQAGVFGRVVVQGVGVGTIDVENEYDDGWWNWGPPPCPPAWQCPDTDTDRAAMSALNVPGNTPRVLAPNEETKASISVFEHVTVVDDSVFSWGKGQIAVDTDGAFTLTTAAPTFVPPTE